MQRLRLLGHQTLDQALQRERVQGRAQDPVCGQQIPELPLLVDDMHEHRRREQLGVAGDLAERDQRGRVADVELEHDHRRSERARQLHAAAQVALDHEVELHLRELVADLTPEILGRAEHEHDRQLGLASAGQLRARLWSAPAHRLGDVGGQRQAKHRAAPELALHPQLTAHHPRQAAADRQAEARAAEAAPASVVDL